MPGRLHVPGQAELWGHSGGGGVGWVAGVALVRPEAPHGGFEIIPCPSPRLTHFASLPGSTKPKALLKSKDQADGRLRGGWETTDKGRRCFKPIPSGGGI